MPANEDDENGDGMTINPTVLGIIHLVDITTSSPTRQSVDWPNKSASGSQANKPSQQQQSADQMMSSSESDGDSSSTPSASNSSKVIRIYFPSKPTNSLNSSETHSNLANKKPRFDQPEQSLNASTNATASQGTFSRNLFAFFCLLILPSLIYFQNYACSSSSSSSIKTPFVSFVLISSI